MVRIYKGDDTGFGGIGDIVVTIATELDLTGFTGRFSLLGIDKTFTPEEIAAKEFRFSYTADETKTFPLGQSTGTFYLFDTRGRVAAVQRILVEVIPHRAVSGRTPSSVTIGIENVYDYDKLGNRPKIGGITLAGNQTPEQLSLQAKLVSGTSIKTINGQSVLGSGNMELNGSVTLHLEGGTLVAYRNGQVIGFIDFTPVN